MGIVYKNFLQTTISEDITATSTHVKVDDYSLWIAGMSAGDFFYSVAVDASNTREIFRVNFDGSSVALGLAIDRGIDGTTAQAWGAGTIFWQDITAAMLEDILQKSVFREGAFIPDATLSADYTGEKFYQTDLQLWWKAVAESSSDWRLIAGEILTENPFYTPVAGTYINGTTIVIESNTTGSDIYYTTDGSAPDSGDTEYTAPVSLPDNSTTTLKSIAYGPERYFSPSAITSGDFTMQSGGTAWTVVATDLTIGLASMVEWNGELYFPATDGRTYKYNSTGGTFDVVNNFTGFTNPKYLFVANSNNLYAMSSVSSFWVMLVYNGAGSDWTNAGSIGLGVASNMTDRPPALEYSQKSGFASFCGNINLRYWDFSTTYTLGPTILAGTSANGIATVDNDGSGSDRLYIGCSDGNIRRLNIAQNGWDLTTKATAWTGVNDLRYDSANNRLWGTDASGRVAFYSGTWTQYNQFSARSFAVPGVLAAGKFYFTAGVGAAQTGQLLEADPSNAPTVTSVAPSLGYEVKQLVAFGGTIYGLTNSRLLRWD